VRVQPEKIDIFNKIVEAYDNLAIVSTVSAAEGTLACWVTEDMRPILLKLIGKMPIKVEILENYAEIRQPEGESHAAEN
jgi:hypothetical protein